MGSNLIDRQAVIDVVRKNTFRLTFAEERGCEGHVAWSAEAVYSDVIEGALLELPSAQPERLTDDDFETIRIHLSAYKERLCNQRRWKEAEEYQRIIDRFISFASAQQTLFGYKIEHLAYIAKVMEKEGITAECAVRTFGDMSRAIRMIIEEAQQKAEEMLNERFNQQTGGD